MITQDPHGIKAWLQRNQENEVKFVLTAVKFTSNRGYPQQKTTIFHPRLRNSYRGWNILGRGSEYLPAGSQYSIRG